MAKTTKSQRKTVGRVMHEYAHGDLKSGPRGKAGTVKSRKQAVAIALSEAGASRKGRKSAKKKTAKKKVAKKKSAKRKTASRRNSRS